VKNNTDSTAKYTVTDHAKGRVKMRRSLTVPPTRCPAGTPPVMRARPICGSHSGIAMTMRISHPRSATRQEPVAWYIGTVNADDRAGPAYNETVYTPVSMPPVIRIARFDESWKQDIA